MRIAKRRINLLFLLYFSPELYFYTPPTPTYIVLPSTFYCIATQLNKFHITNHKINNKYLYSTLALSYDCVIIFKFPLTPKSLYVARHD